MRSLVIALGAVLVTACGASEQKGPENVITVAVDAGPSTPIVVTTAPPPEKTTPAPTSLVDGPTGFSLKSLTSGRAELVAGKVTVVHFWATWCGPCAQSLPKLQALSAKLKGRGLEVVAISVDDDAAGVADFARNHGVRFPVGWDDGHAIAVKYKVESMPSTYIVDRDGAIRHSHSGYHDGEDAEIEREVSSLL